MRSEIYKERFKMLEMKAKVICIDLDNLIHSKKKQELENKS